MDKEINVGSNVTYNLTMKCLPKGSIGIVADIYGKKATISYPQFAPQENKGKYLYSNYVYAHSSNLSDLTLIP